MGGNPEIGAGGGRVLFETRYSKKIFNRPIIVGVLAIPLLVGGILHPYISLVGVLFLFMAGITFLNAHLRRGNTVYQLTSDRVIIRSGVLFRKSREVMLGKIAAVYIEEDARDGRYGTGTLVLAETSGRDERITGIENMAEFRKLVHELLTK